MKKFSFSMLKSKLITFLLALIAVWSTILLAFSASGQEMQSVSSPYHYPIKPGTDQWKSFSSHLEMINACQIPNNLLPDISTEDLIETVMTYPLLFDYLAYDNHEVGFQNILGSFNGLSDLMKRSDAGSKLVKYYQSQSIDIKLPMFSLNERATYSFKLTFIELMLCHGNILSSLSQDEKLSLMRTCLANYESEMTNPDLFGLVSEGGTVRLAAKILLNLKYDKFEQEVSSNPDVKSFLEFQNPYLDNLNYNLIIEKCSEFIKQSGNDPNSPQGDLSVPTVTTSLPLLYSYDPNGTYTYQLGGNVTNSGGYNVTARGVCVNTYMPPTTQYQIGSGTGSFSALFSNFQQGTTYFVRAYAKNTSGTGYGSIISFITCGYTNTYVYTPKNHSVSVMYRSCEPYSSAQISSMNTQFNSQYPNAIYLSTSTGKYNCHSYGWYQQSTSNPDWMNNPSIYWTDGSYLIQGGNLSIGNKTTYTNSGSLAHTAYVYQANVSKTTGQVKSKWGACPLFQHAINYCPYYYSSTVLKYYKLYNTYKDEEGELFAGKVDPDVFSVYPNPSSGFFSITGPKENGQSEISISNMNGQVLYHQVNCIFPSKIDLTNYPKGIYILTCINVNEMKTIKLVVN